MVFIWYNPDLDAYQLGSLKEYDRLLMKSDNNDRFDLLYEFNATTESISSKILYTLNLEREINAEKVSAYQSG